MSEIITQPHPYPIQLDLLYAISRTTTRNLEWKRALDEIAVLVRKILIFDNLVVYRTDNSQQSFEVAYARAAGRGRSSEADATWGDMVAHQILQTHQTMLTEPPALTSTDRLDRPYTLGIPLLVGEQVLGVIVFVRFGGPIFTEENVELAEFIARQITYLVPRMTPFITPT